jgi:hypothetical protein
MLARDARELPSWGVGANADRSIRDAEIAHEKRVSTYLGAMTLFWLDVPDESGPQSARAIIERNAIALLSNGSKPIDAPSSGWLGLHSPCEDIRQSGLWNVNHVRQTYEPGFLELLQASVTRTGAHLLA